MSEFISAEKQWQDVNGKPIVNGSIYIGIVNLDPKLNPTNIFSDRDLTVPLANPVLTDSRGAAATKIWIPGRYSIKLEDSNGVQIMEELDNGVETAGIVTILSVAGTNTITGAGTPTITAYVDKEQYIWRSVGENTGAVTQNWDSVGAKDLLDSNGVALSQGDIPADVNVVTIFDSTADNFYLVNPLRATSPYVASQIIAYTVAAADVGQIHVLSGTSFTVTLPAVATVWNGFTIAFKYAGTPGTDIYTIDGNASETIDLALTKDLTTDNEFLSVVVDGTNWKINNSILGSRVLLAETTASASASIDFDAGIDFVAFKKYEIEIIDVVPATDGEDLYVRTSTDGGSTYDAGASDYSWGYDVNIETSTGITRGDIADAQINITFTAAATGWGNTAGESLNGHFTLWNPSGTNQTIISFIVDGIRDIGDLMSCRGSGRRASAADVDGIQFLMSSGNITSGTFKLYGVK